MARRGRGRGRRRGVVAPARGAPHRHPQHHDDQGRQTSSNPHDAPPEEGALVPGHRPVWEARRILASSVLTSLDVAWPILGAGQPSSPPPPAGTAATSPPRATPATPATGTMPPS